MVQNYVMQVKSREYVSENDAGMGRSGPRFSLNRIFRHQAPGDLTPERAVHNRLWPPLRGSLTRERGLRR